MRRVIYRLWHDLSPAGRVGYVGKDSRHPKRWCLVERSKDKESPKLYRALNKYPLDVWNKEILAEGFESDEELNAAEISWIAKFDSKNKGYNCTDGGDGAFGRVPSLESREKQSKAMMGKPSWSKGKTGIFSKETLQRMSDARKGVRWSEEAKKRMSETRSGENHPLYGKRHSEESKEKMSIAHKGKKLSSEHKRNLSLAKLGNQNAKGLKHTPEVRRRISKSLVGNQNAKGNKLSEETRKRMSEASRRNWAKRKAEKLNLSAGQSKPS